MISVTIATMKLSDGRKNYYVRVSRADRTYDVNKYGADFYNRALYEQDELKHVLLGHPKPDLTADKYADKVMT
ncbi:hypothetical protein BD1_54 [Octadecabacter Antarctic BD virus 1]|nr:hypothetical protein BD1_54 [Octadecabacter Antarctic BD virus 1]